MKPISIRLVNYRSFADETIHFPDGVTALTGQNHDEPGSASNGSGKSSILTALHEALFDVARPADQLRRRADAMLLDLVVEHAGETYRIRRHHRGRRNTLDLDRWEAPALSGVDGDWPATWVPLTRESKAATQRLLEQTLNINETTWLASAFLAQGDAGAFCSAKPAQRRAIIGESLGENITLWGRLLDQARTEKSTKRDELARLQGRLEAIERDSQHRSGFAELVAKGLADIARLEPELAAAEQRLAAATEAADHARAQQAARAAAERLLGERRDAYRQAQTRADDLADLILAAEQAVAGRGDLEARAARVDELQAAYEQAGLALANGQRIHDQRQQLQADHARLLRDASSHSAQAETAETRVGALAEKLRGIQVAEDATCHACHQPIGGDAKAAAIADLEAQIEAAKEVRDEHVVKAREFYDHVAAVDQALSAAGPLPLIGILEAQVATSRIAVSAATEAARQLAGVNAQAERLDELKREHADAIGKLPELASAGADARKELELLASASDVEAAIKAHANHQAAVAAARATLAQARETKERNEGVLEMLDDSAAQAEQVKVGADQLRVDLAGIAACERAYAADGIPALLVESIAVPQVETEATRILGELGTNWRVELRTQREKSGGGLAEALDIVIVQPDGETTYEGLSGGEKSRANIAIRIALAQLLARQRGAELKVLAIDELEWLDESGLEHLAGVLRGLRGVFDQVVVVSHHPAMRDAFDQQLVVEKRDGASRLVAA